MNEDDLSDKQRQFLDLLFGEARGNISEVGRIMEISAPHDMAKNLRKYIIARSEEHLASLAAKAVHVIEDVMDETASQVPGVMNRLAGAKETLDRIGIVKTDKISVTGESIGLVVLPEKKNVQAPAD